MDDDPLGRNWHLVTEKREEGTHSRAVLTLCVGGGPAGEMEPDEKAPQGQEVADVQTGAHERGHFPLYLQRRRGATSG